MLGLLGFAALVAAWGAVCGLVYWLYRRGTLRRDLHRDVAAIGVLVLVTLGFYWPLFFTESWIPKGGGDLASFIYPIYAFGARWLKRGVIPLWNPHLYLGMPFAADNQTGLFYPVNLLFFLLTPMGAMKLFIKEASQTGKHINPGTFPLINSLKYVCKERGNIIHLVFWGIVGGTLLS